MPLIVDNRCQRCGTKIRNNRSICPSCGLDFNAEPETGSGGPESKQIRKVQAKAGVKICALCMATVPEDQIVELDGQKVCQPCAEVMKTKAAKKAQPK